MTHEQLRAFIAPYVADGQGEKVKSIVAKYSPTGLSTLPPESEEAFMAEVKLLTLESTDSAFKTVGGVLDAIPDEWRKAEIFIGVRLGDVKPVLRVSLSENGNGRRCVIIHQEDFSE